MKPSTVTTRLLSVPCLSLAIIFLLSVPLAFPAPTSAQASCPDLTTGYGNATYSFSSVASGSHSLWLRIKGTDGSPTVKYNLSGGGTSCDQTLTTTGATSWKWVKSTNTLTTSGGTVTLKLYGAEASVGVDCIVLTSDTSFAPSTAAHCAGPQVTTPPPPPPPPTPIADMNGDLKVNIFDLSFLLARWGTNNALADLDDNGTVNIVDLSRLLAQWGRDDSVPPSTGAQPTRDNTGPRYALTDMTPDQFLTSRTCNRQRINGNVNFDQQWMKGQTFTLTDCEITGQMYIYIQGGGTPLSYNDMPIITMDYVDILSGMNTLNAARITADHSYIAGSQFVLKDYWAPFITGSAPYVFSNSMFYGLYASQPTHTEALHVADYGSGYQFINVAFVQQGGPLANSGVTATINFHGSDALFDGCWFIWDGAQVPTYFTAYLDGINTIVRNSKFAAGASGYIYPSSANNPTFTNNTDVATGAAVNGP